MTVKLTLQRRVIYALPATLGELVAVTGIEKALVNSVLCRLRNRGLVRRTERRGDREHAKGAAPHIWDLA